MFPRLPLPRCSNRSCRIGEAEISTLAIGVQVPQWSIVSPVLFDNHNKPLGKVIWRFGEGFPKYANDIHLSLSLSHFSI